MGDDDEKTYSTIIKIDRITRDSAAKIVEGARRAAHKYAPGARGTFVTTPTKKLRGADGQREIEQGNRKLLTSHKNKDERMCKATTNSGRPCSHRALDGNYGFCGKHREK
jgi:hypothetical protein